MYKADFMYILYLTQVVCTLPEDILYIIIDMKYIIENKFNLCFQELKQRKITCTISKGTYIKHDMQLKCSKGIQNQVHVTVACRACCSILEEN